MYKFMHFGVWDSITKKRRVLKVIISFVLIVLCLFSCSNQDYKDDKSIFKKTVIWDAGKRNVDGYRIPGIVVAKDGTVLAFSEERNLHGDAEPKSIVLKRSEDKGATWSENVYIEKSNGNYWSNHSDLIDPKDVQNKKEVWTNPAPIVDYETGRIFIFYALNEGEVAGQNLQRYTSVFYKYSDDNGISWSDRKEVTDILNVRSDGSPNKDKNGNWITNENGFHCDYLGRSFHMPGPGHGIQLSSGRLLLQVWSRKALGVMGQGSIPINERKYGISTIYSDDHGKTWHYGSAFGHDFGINESRMVELKNGDVYLNARYWNTDPDKKNPRRVTAISHDGGIHWKNIKIDKHFPLSISCDAGLVSMERSTENKQFILYSKNESTEERKNLVVRLSNDGGKNWPVSKVVDEGAAGYSDMAVLDDNSVLLIYETGSNNPLYLVKFNLKWLFDEKKKIEGRY